MTVKSDTRTQTRDPRLASFQVTEAQIGFPVEDPLLLVPSIRFMGGTKKGTKRGREREREKGSKRQIVRERDRGRETAAGRRVTSRPVTFKTCPTIRLDTRKGNLFITNTHTNTYFA